MIYKNKTMVSDKLTTVNIRTSRKAKTQSSSDLTET